MNKRPRSIAVIAWLFIAVGCLGILKDVLPLATPHASQRIADLHSQGAAELGLIWVVRLLAVVGGAFILYGFNWARWLLVGWMGYHVALSVFHSPLELLVHSVLFGAILWLLFRPEASLYFRGRRALQAERSGESHGC